MNPTLRDGSTVYPPVFKKIRHIGDLLEARGYVERGRKANLFVRFYRGVKFYADFDTEVIRPWEDERPLFYWYFDKGTSLDILPRQRMILLEWTRLLHVPKRLSHDLPHGPAETYREAELILAMHREELTRLRLAPPGAAKGRRAPFVLDQIAPEF